MAREPMPMDVGRLRDLYAKGYSLNEVAALLGVAHTTVLRRMKLMRIPRRPPGILPTRHLKVSTLGPEEIKGLAAWLRASAGARCAVELAPNTAATIAALLEAAVDHEQRSAA